MMSSSVKSVNYLTKSLLRLQLLKSEIKNNCFNNKQNYSVFSLQKRDCNINYNNCKNKKLIIKRYNHDNHPESAKSKVRNQIFRSRRGNFSHSSPENVEKSLAKANENLTLIFESEHPSTIKRSPVVELAKNIVIDDKNEIDDENEFLIDKTARKLKILGPLDICNEDLSFIAPFTSPTFNFAAYANKSETIQQLVKLGVELYKVEMSVDGMKSLLRRNFDEIKPYIQFLHDCRVQADDIGRCLTKFPMIVDEDLDDLHTRIRYLRAHKFSIYDIARIVTVVPRWLSFTTKEIDGKLGYIQRELSLNGDQMRLIIVRQPKLIMSKRSMLRENFFSIKEEMCFNEYEIKKIIMEKPGIFMIDRKLIAATFGYVYNKMLIPHEIMANMPIILMTPLTRIKDRHEFLKLFKRDQYDPTKPLYVSLDDVACPTDYEFCTRIAKTSIQLYDMFLKTR